MINAQRAISLALDHETIGVGHLLLALRYEQRGSIAQILTRNGFDVHALTADLERHAPSLLTSAEPIFELSLESAERHSNHYTGTEHLLLAILSLPDSDGLMQHYGIHAESLRQAVQQQLSHKR